jgi:hypothetical protein
VSFIHDLIGVSLELRDYLSEFMSQVVKPRNVKGDGVADDTAALQKAIDRSIARGLPLELPAGTFRTTTTLTAVSNNVMIKGAGGKLTRIKPDAYTYDAIVIGPGASGSGIAPSGYIQDVFIEGSTSWVTGTTAALKLDGMRQFEVKNVTIERMPIAFDLVNNCYGSMYYNCRANLVGLPYNIRTGPQSGSDLTFINCWGRGKDGFVWVAPGAGGIHFRLGQATGGDNQGANNDDVGVVTLGKDYITGTTGTVANVDFDGIDFEGSKYIHQVRIFGQCLLDIRNSSFLSTGVATAAEKPLGIIKATTANQSRITLTNNAVAGEWKAAKSIDVAGQGSVLNIVEVNPSMINGTATFNGVPHQDKWSLLEQSQNTMGIAFTRSDSTNKILLGGMMIRPNIAGSNMEVSFNWGANWFSLNKTAI